MDVPEAAEAIATDWQTTVILQCVRFQFDPRLAPAQFELTSSRFRHVMPTAYHASHRQAFWTPVEQKNIQLKY